MEALAQNVPQALILLLLAGFLLFLQTTKRGTEIQFFVLFAVVASAVPTAITAGASLAFIGLLFPHSVVASGFADLLWLVVLASLISMVVFDLGAEGGLLWILQKLRASPGTIRIVEEMAASLFIAAALLVASLLIPDAELSVSTALITGLICGLVRYFLGLYVNKEYTEESKSERRDQILAWAAIGAVVLLSITLFAFLLNLF